MGMGKYIAKGKDGRPYKLTYKGDSRYLFTKVSSQVTASAEERIL